MRVEFIDLYKFVANHLIKPFKSLMELFWLGGKTILKKTSKSKKNSCLISPYSLPPKYNRELLSGFCDCLLQSSPKIKLRVAFGFLRFLTTVFPRNISASCSWVFVIYHYSLPPEYNLELLLGFCDLPNLHTVLIKKHKTLKINPRLYFGGRL